MPAVRRAPAVAAAPRFGLRAAVLAALVAVAAAPADPANPVDVRLQFKVRGTLNADRRLAALPLHVEVKGCVATLTGTVPSDAVAQYAVEVAGRVVGLSGVTCNLLVRPDDGKSDGPRAFVVPPNEAPARQVPLKKTMPDPERRDETAPAATLGAPEPVEPSPPAPPALAVARPVVPTPTAAPGSTLATLVDEARRKEPRFRDLRAEVVAGDVVLSGRVARWDDVDDLARVVRRLTGVRRVVIGSVQVDATARGRP